MTNKFLLSKGALWRKCLAYVKHMLSIFWTSLQPQRKVSVTSALFGTQRDANFQLAQESHTKSRRSPLMLRKMAAMFLLLFGIGIGNAWGTMYTDTSLSVEVELENGEAYGSFDFILKNINILNEVTKIGRLNELRT